MSFSRGFNSGFGMVLDAKRLRMQEDEAERIRKRDERRDALTEEKEFGYYQNQDGVKISQEDAFITTDTGEKSLKDGINFVGGEGAYRSVLTDVKQEDLESKKFLNSPEMRALTLDGMEFLNKSREAEATTNTLGASRNMTTDQSTELVHFFSQYDPFMDDIKTFNEKPQAAKDMFSMNQAALAQAMEEKYGDNPLDVFLDANVEGYQTAGFLQNAIMKNPDIISDINLADYGSGLNSLFNLQTKKFIGKKFRGKDVEGTVTNVELDFEGYNLDANNNTLTLRANYTVEEKDGTIKTINGVLNDTNRDIIDPEIAQKDEVAFSLNDLLDHASAGASMQAYMSDPKFHDFIKQTKIDNEKKAAMFPAANYGRALELQNKAMVDFRKQIPVIDKQFNNIDADIIYGELFGKRNNYGDTQINDEVNLINDMISNMSGHLAYLEETELEAYKDTGGLRIKRDKNDQLMPLYELKTYGYKSIEEIHNAYVNGEENLFTNLMKITYRFDSIENDLNDSMSLVDIQTEFDKANPLIYTKITNVLKAANMEVNAKNILDFAKRLDEDGSL